MQVICFECVIMLPYLFQPTAEQLRLAQMISDSKRDDPELPDKVNKVLNCSFVLNAYIYHCLSLAGRTHQLQF